jgi:hypothetical protein
MAIQMQAAVAGEILRQAFQQIQRDFPLAAPADVDAFVKSAFHRSNSGGMPLNVSTIVGDYHYARRGE